MLLAKREGHFCICGRFCIRIERLSVARTAPVLARHGDLDQWCPDSPVHIHTQQQHFLQQPAAIDGSARDRSMYVHVYMNINEITL